MAYRYTPKDVDFVRDKLKAGFTQKETNLSYHFWRASHGTETKKGDYTNFISKLTKGSKHREKTTKAAADYYHKGEVVRAIKDYLKCSLAEAKHVYRRNFLPLCVSGYHNTNLMGLISIRNYFSAASSYLYLLFTTPNYRENMSLAEDDPKTDDLWTVKTSSTWGEIATGEYDRDAIQQELEGYAGGQYVPELVNVCVQKL